MDLFGRGENTNKIDQKILICPRCNFKKTYTEDSGIGLYEYKTADIPIDNKNKIKVKKYRCPKCGMAITENTWRVGDEKDKSSRSEDGNERRQI